MKLRKQVVDVLKECYDPEIPIDLWSLGLIYDIKISDPSNKKYSIDIIMSLTTPGCSMGQHMADDIKTKVSSLTNVNSVEVQVTFDPPWTPEMMNDKARKKLGFEPVKSSSNNNQIDTEWE
ncbi:MAG: FeS assembly SUF system protein [Candidatus Marinimicrobia bacterium]|nr:FeS assembly SUF system protein [Candidatus Neomarinimicrobiota bacterium]|tara:strand:- start:1476 stop:1838 length:363 start_codon:yes stop_codon:yes gene_type:complete